jgi:uncharacterized membrane protein YbaN (DUF454 family)
MNTIRRERRPLWQRLLLPIVGALMIMVGAFGLFVPIIPGILLLVVGFPLLFCFHETSEDWARDVMQRCCVRITRFFMPKRSTSDRGASRVNRS